MSAAVEPRAALQGERARQSLPAKITSPNAVAKVSVLVATSTLRKAS